MVWLLRGVIIVAVAASGWTTTVRAQEHVTVRGDVLFYGDNTEFHNPFREGETILGTALRGVAVLGLNDAVSLTVGAFGNVRFGSDEAFEAVRPVVTLRIDGARSSFVFGTLPTPQAGAPPGPDRTGPHGLLPPLQRETLAFDRPYEAGLAWSYNGRSLDHAAWVNWQRLNTSDHRERFDAGALGTLRLSPHVALPLQLHIVHEGGQLFSAGPVADSLAAAAGVDVHGAIFGLDRAGIEVYGLVSRYVPDRGNADRSRDGVAFFSRASAERRGWRGHLIVWRGKRFIKDEGDANYLSIARSGQLYRGTRDYAETGLTRTFAPAPGLIVEASGRLHRIEKHYEYSFRIIAVTSVSLTLR